MDRWAGPVVPEDPDLRNIIERTAEYVRRNGIMFEKMTMEKNAGNERFGFLFPGHVYHMYYKSLTDSMAGTSATVPPSFAKPPPPPPMPASVMSTSTRMPPNAAETPRVANVGNLFEGIPMGAVVDFHKKQSEAEKEAKPYAALDAEAVLREWERAREAPPPPSEDLAEQMDLFYRSL